jgi:hypothetical protein
MPSTNPQLAWRIGRMARSAASVELAESTRIAVNETDQARMRDAIDIKFPYVTCPKATVEFAPVQLEGEATSPSNPDG